MISISYTGMVLIFCAIQIILIYGVFWYLKKSILDAKDQFMVDIRSLVPIIKSQEQEIITARSAALQARDYCADIKQEIANQASKAGVG